MRSIIPAVKGTRDFYPEDLAIRTWLYGVMRQVSESFGYQEYDGPFLETMELYAAKSGDELVKDQSYAFRDRGGDMITLRPELTPSLVRMIAQRQRQLTYPLRWWSFGPFWRYERPQKGRTREFFQWNVDMIGVDSPEADAEMVAVLATFFRSIGLTPDKVVIVVNNRRLIDAELTALDIRPETRPDVSNWIDRRDKMQPSDWETYGSESGLTPAQIAGVQTLLDNPNLWQKSNELVRFFAALQSLGVSDYVQFNPGIVRGLLYYTGTVIEAQEISGDIRRAILGGGRYDNLMADVGGEPLPGVGFAMGDVVITLILQKYGLLPKELNKTPADVLVTIFDADQLLASFSLAAELRQAGLKVSCYPEAARLSRQFKYADRMGIRVAVVVGPDEAARGQASVKDLVTGDQQTLQLAQVLPAIRVLLDRNTAS